MNEQMPAQPLEVTVNLEAAQAQFLAQIQRRLEIMTFCFTGQDQVNETNYGNYDKFFAQINPDKKPDLNKVKLDAESWLSCHFLTDAVNLAGVFLEEVRIICGVYDLAKNKTFSDKDLNLLLSEERKKFHRLGIPYKIEFLKKQFGVESAFSDHLLSLNRARNCLEHRLGIVTDIDAGVNGTLEIKCRTIHFVARFKDGKEVVIDKAGYVFEEQGEFCIQVIDKVKTFKLGEKIALDHDQLFSCMMTLFVLSGTFLESALNFGKRIGTLAGQKNNTPNA
jgi:hypothetical protein